MGEWLADYLQNNIIQVRILLVAQIKKRRSFWNLLFLIKNKKTIKNQGCNIL